MPPKHHPLIGAHFSVAGGLENALITAADLDCNAVQIFTKNARTWKESHPTPDQIEIFKRLREKHKIQVVLSHCSYLINVAAGDEEKRKKAEEALVNEMKRSAALGLDHVVLHPGAHLGRGVEEGIATAIGTLGAVLAQDPGDFPRLLLETTAGQGSCLGSRFEELRDLLAQLPDKTGVCLDTSHIFAAGYDIRTRETYQAVMADFHRTIGLEKLYAIHTNDSIPPLDSKKDRHAHIGKGCIGDEGFAAIMQDPRLENIPKILETPKDMDGKAMDPVNLSRLRELMAG
ncbi:MAG: deoxyribonuclease IV [Desulfobacterales bacterium]|nr:deoxyribonuclease IV [Desulfobacterales bacterium]